MRIGNPQNGQTGSLTMSILKAVMVGFRGWNNFLVALNMYVRVSAGCGQTCGESTLCLIFTVKFGYAVLNQGQ